MLQATSFPESAPDSSSLSPINPPLLHPGIEVGTQEAVVTADLHRVYLAALEHPPEGVAGAMEILGYLSQRHYFMGLVVHAALS